MLFLKIFSNKEVRQKKAKAKNVENTAKKKDFLDQTNLVENTWETYSNGMDSSDEDNIFIRRIKNCAKIVFTGKKAEELVYSGVHN